MAKVEYIGCISGTSVDGLDVAHLSIDPDTGALELGAATTVPLPETLRDDLLRLANPSADEMELLGRCDTALGRFVGEAINTFIDSNALARSAIRAIGSHGQTVRHRPPPAHGPNEAFTLQIGDPNAIAELTGITTVADFRRRDMAAGGQGAPLVPPFHHALFARELRDGCTVVVNIGGISNVSLLGTTSISGYDTGPGNCLMDLWTSRHLHQPYDADGAWAAGGTVIAALLDEFLTDPYFAAPAPKSTGREYFNAAWLDAHDTSVHKPVDVQATLTALTARTVASAFPDDTAAVVLCGGGRLNGHLVAALAQASAAPVTSCDALGVNGDAIEAAAFAWLAHQRLAHATGNAPAVTGAKGERVLGAVYPGG